VSRPRLTRHQRLVLSDVIRRSHGQPGRWVQGRDIGSPGALAHLVAKGYLSVQVSYGPRGGEYRAYRLAAEPGQ